MDPFEVEECSIGTGVAYGAMYLNERFQQLLHEKIGDCADEILTTRRLAEAIGCFETTIKCQFNPFSSLVEDEYEIPLPGAPDLPLIGLEGGYLTLYMYLSLPLVLTRKGRY